MVGILQQLGQLQWVLADLLHWGQQEAIEGGVNHLLQQLAGLTEIHVLVELGEPGELYACVGMVVGILLINLEVCLLGSTTGS